MQVTQKKSEKLKRELEVVVEASEVEKRLEEKLENVAKNVKIPGFRPGKVPMDIVRKKHGTAVMGEVLEQTVAQTSRDAVSQQGLRPAMRPKIEIVDFKEGADLRYTMEFEVLPDVPELGTDKITLNKTTAEIKDADIQQTLDELAARAKHYHKVEEARAAVKGDALLIDFEGFVDGVAFPGGKAEKYQLELGSNTFIPGFEDQLTGKKAGEDTVVKVTFPETYHQKDLAGKPAEFKVKVHELRSAGAHEMNDELASHFGFKTLDELKNAIKSQLERECNNVSRAAMKKELFDYLDSNCKFEVPEEMVKVEFDTIWSQLQEAKAANPDSEEFKKGEDKLKEEYQKMAERRVRLGIILAEIGQKEKLSVDQKDLTDAVLQRARQFPGQEQRVFEYYQKNPYALEEFRGPILEEKVVDHLISKAKTTEKKASLEDIRALEKELS